MLPIYRQLLKQEELDLIDGMNEVDAYRWITSLRRIDWDKFFNGNFKINELVSTAANSIPGGPIAFLKPEFVDFALQKHKSNCPSSIINYYNSFKEAAKLRKIEKMRSWYKLIKTLIEYS